MNKAAKKENEKKCTNQKLQCSYLMRCHDAAAEGIAGIVTT